MKPSDRRRLALLGGYVAATFLAFPHPVADRVLDLGVVLAWLSPMLLVLALEGRRAGRLAFVASLAAHSLILHWIYVVTVVYGHAPVVAGLLAPVALAAYVAAFSSAFGAGWAALGRHGLASPLAAALLWTALDHLRSFALSGFPWATLGYAQHLNPPLLGLAPFTGVYGLSFVTVLGGAGLARGVQDLLARRRPGPGLWAGNIAQDVKWSRERADEILGIYEDLSRRAAAQGARIIVWPETAVPGGIEADPALRRRLGELGRETGAAFVLGGVGLEWEADPGPARFFDSAFLLDPAGGFRDRYDKSHLVPFGEYVPLGRLLGSTLVAIARGAATTGVTPGAGPRPLLIDLPGSPFEKVSAGVAICYELLFPDLVRRFAGGGAEVLFAITNDAWYGRTGAPYQFLAMTAVRSAETRLWTARAANTGVSAIIDARGRVRSRTRIFERDLLVSDLPLRPVPIGGSFYTRHGDVFAYACWAGVAGLVLAHVRAKRVRVSGDE
jgi:apolipoprotein N-acyltransferase